MGANESIGDRLRSSLRRTRERISASWSGAETPDWDALEESLILADVGLEATSAILDGMRSRSTYSQTSLREELMRVLGDLPAERVAVEPPRVTTVVGVNGVGKTTTVAKLAHLAVTSGKTALVVAADTFRAAAQEQLATWAARVGVDVIEGSSGKDPASVVHDGIQAALARGIDEVLVDTAGRLHTKRPLMDELGKIERVASRVVSGAPHDTLLVMDATVGTNGLAQAKQFASTLRLTGIVLTKMDGTAKGGVVLAIARELRVPVCFVGVGEAADALLPFTPEDFVEALLAE